MLLGKERTTETEKLISQSICRSVWLLSILQAAFKKRERIGSDVKDGTAAMAQWAGRHLNSINVFLSCIKAVGDLLKFRNEELAKRVGWFDFSHHNDSLDPFLASFLKEN